MTWHRTLYAALMIGLSFAGLNQAAAETVSNAELKNAAHPAMAAFIADIAARRLDKAAERIAKIGDFDGDEYFVMQPTRQQLASLLADCAYAKGDFGKGTFFSPPLQITEWQCADGKRYLINFWAMDSFYAKTTVPRPYLMVGSIETPEFRAAREAKRIDTPIEDIPPPIRVKEFSEQERQEWLAKEARERQASFGHRDIIGDALVRGEFDEITKFATADTQVSYSTKDPYFGVKIEHGRGKGAMPLQTMLQQAVNDLGKPVSVQCYLPETQWAGQVCRWELSNPGNGLFAEMYFRGPGGMLNSFSIIRETPSESAAFKQRAAEMGMANG